MLAQEWLYGERRNSPLDGMLDRALRLPSVHSAALTPETLDGYAERFVFDEDLPSVLYDLYDNRQLDFDGMAASVRLPHDTFWLEYRSNLATDPSDSGEYLCEMTRTGVLVTRLGEGVSLLIVAEIRDQRTRMKVSGIIRQLFIPMWPLQYGVTPPRADLHIYTGDPDAKRGGVIIPLNVLWGFEDNGRFKSVNLDESTTPLVAEVLFGIFLLTQPKVYSDEPVIHRPQLVKHRAKHGKPPLLEYRRLRLHIGQTVKRQEARRRTLGPSIGTESDEAIRHRQYHKVMGHFRHYLHAKPPRTVWIEPHYRGDPKLGVRFNERHVTR